MRRGLSLIFILSGTILSIFVFNIVMYAAVPAYRGMLEAAVGGPDEKIPVAAPRQADSTSDATLPVTAVTTDAADIKSDDSSDTTALNEESTEPADESLLSKKYEYTYDKNEQYVNEKSTDGEEKTLVINKEYHEDCGTGKGYWVITYADGSTAVEE